LQSDGEAIGQADSSGAVFCKAMKTMASLSVTKFWFTDSALLFIGSHMDFMQAAIAEAKKGLAAGGIPIGSVLVRNGEIIGRGHNQRVQLKNPSLWNEDIGEL
jgi:hypothetical protein